MGFTLGGPFVLIVGITAFAISVRVSVVGVAVSFVLASRGVAFSVVVAWVVAIVGMASRPSRSVSSAVAGLEAVRFVVTFAVGSARVLMD